MHRVIENINIVRLFSFTILMGVFLSANSNSENLPAPIPIDFGVNYGMRSDTTFCDSCNTLYDAEAMGASCCDEATYFNSDFTCDVLETTYLWNCSDCDCELDGDDWTSDFGCQEDMNACNYNPDAKWDSCIYAEENFDCDGNCTAEVDCAGECGGSSEVDACDVCDGDGIADGDCDCDGNINLGCGCGEDGPSGCDNNCGSDLEDDECDVCGGDGSSCTSWTELIAVGGENQISLQLVPKYSK